MGQLIPAGELVTLPSPFTDTVSVCCTGGISSKTALTLWLEDIKTEQAAVPVHAPDQACNRHPSAGMPVKFMLAP